MPITYTDKDKTAPVGQPERTWRDVDANEVKAVVNDHIADVANPHGTTAAQVGLSNVNNTADTAKPVSTAQQAAIDAKVSQTVTNGVTTSAPSQDAVYDLFNASVEILLTPTGDITNATNVASDISGLSVTLEANSRYALSGDFHIGCNNTGGVQFGFVTPTLTTYYTTILGTLNSATALTFGAFAADGVGVPALCTISGQGRGKFGGTLTVGVNAGTFKLQFASTTNGQTSTIFKEGTILRLVKL